MDFYQRATLSSYCSAFSYQPMVESMANYFDDLYLELPNHSKDTLTSEPVSPGVARYVYCAHPDTWIHLKMDSMYKNLKIVFSLITFQMI